jgi:Na+/H+-dicarboxylate symporter
MRRLALHWQIIIAIALAVIAGWLTGADGELLGASIGGAYDFVGTLFLNALKMLIVPLVMSSIIVGVAGIGSSGDLGRLGGKTVIYYLISSLFAIMMGLLLVNLFQPGYVDGEPAGHMLALDGDPEVVAANLGEPGSGALIEIFLRMVPTNIVQAAAEGRMLGLIFFSLLFGYFITRVEHELAAPLYSFWNGVFGVMLRITEWVMRFAPIGVFGLVARTVSETGFQAAGPLLVFSLTVLLALVLHALVTLPLLMRVLGRVRPYRLFPAMAPALMTAFSTASSSATLPVTLDCLEKKAGVSNRIGSFVLPLGATVNMDGTALYECVAAMFIAQAYGIELGVGVQFVIVVTALVTSIGVAGVPSASLVAIAIILTAVGLPISAIGVLLVFDRILDMVRTSVNVLGDSSGAIIIARLEGEDGVLQSRAGSAAA